MAFSQIRHELSGAREVLLLRGEPARGARRRSPGASLREPRSGRVPVRGHDEKTVMRAVPQSDERSLTADAASFTVQATRPSRRRYALDASVPCTQGERARGGRYVERHPGPHVARVSVRSHLCGRAEDRGNRAAHHRSASRRATRADAGPLGCSPISIIGHRTRQPVALQHSATFGSPSCATRSCGSSP